MPNTLAHMGVQALITRRVIPAADLGWVWLGSLLPDVPWILQRLANKLPLEMSAIDLRLYAAIQSSLLFSLVAATGFAALAPRPARVFAILSIGCVLHLLLDATQTKWANGVVLFAPFDWRLVNFSLFWPEDFPSHLLTLVGIAYVAWAMLRFRPGRMGLPHILPPRVVIAAVVAAVWFAGPFSFLSAARSTDMHYAATLGDRSGRDGRPIMFDRAEIVRDAGSAPRLSIWTGETLVLVGLPVPPGADTVSLKGRFAAADVVEVTALHVHAGRRRDILTMIGLGAMACWWLWGLIVSLRSASSMTAGSTQRLSG